MQLKRSKRPVWEYGVVVLVVGVSMWMAITLYAKRDQVFKERLLILELQTFRNLSAAYILEHRSLPKNIREVLGPQSMVRSPWSNQDPFGYPYQYHPANGWISTTHPRYVHW